MCFRPVLVVVMIKSMRFFLDSLFRWMLSAVLVVAVPGLTFAEAGGNLYGGMSGWMQPGLTAEDSLEAGDGWNSGSEGWMQSGLFAKVLPGISGDLDDGPSGLHIPVLCFHTFYPGSFRGTPGSLAESYEAFENILHFLMENGFESYIPGGAGGHTVATEMRPVDYIPGSDHISHQSGPDALKVIITFDDGHRSQLRAAELLEKYGMRGIFFVVPSLIDDPEYPHMTSLQLASLAERGHLVGVHGHRHRSMPVSGPEIIAALDTVPGLLREIPGITEDVLHSLAFPYGHYTPAVRRAMRSRYSYLYSVNPGYWDGQSALIPRILITRDTDRRFFFDYLAGAFEGRRVLHLKEGNGSRQVSVRFDNPENLEPSSLYVQAVTPDLQNHHYSVFAAEPFLSKKNGLLVFDVVEYLETHHNKERRALSFAILQKQDGVLRFVSDGILIWVKKREGDTP